MSDTDNVGPIHLYALKYQWMGPTNMHCKTNMHWKKDKNNIFSMYASIGIKEQYDACEINVKVATNTKSGTQTDTYH